MKREPFMTDFSMPTRDPGEDACTHKWRTDPNGCDCPSCVGYSASLDAAWEIAPTSKAELLRLMMAENGDTAAATLEHIAAMVDTGILAVDETSGLYRG